MKELPKGVFVEGNSLGIDFRYKGKRYPVVLKPNGVALTDSSANRKYASNYREQILAAIRGEKMGGPAFDIEKWLPNSLRVARERTKTAGTIKELIYSWLDNARIGCAHSTMIDFERAGKEFVALWGNLHPSELTVTMIKDWILQCQLRERSRQTIKNMAIVLRGALDLAEEATPPMIEFNPMNKIKWKNIRATEAERIRNSDEDIYPFDFVEIDRLLSNASPWFKNFLILGFALGPRMNELMGLAWEDIDLNKLELHFRFGRVRSMMTTLKTTKSNRIIPLDQFPSVVAALQRQKELTFMYPAQDMGKYGKRHFVFYNTFSNQPFKDCEEILDRFWTPLLRKAGVVYRPAKQMRHTFAIHHRIAGYADLWISKILGHTTTQMLEKHYGRRWPVNADRMAQTKEELIGFWRKVA